ncbi:MAG: alpha/beta hydrolase [Verrucomicrobiota bacterium JB023]|nr:alpha/beta hydrolase [Verrucomicrobiota bacterium JB023]
MRCWASPAWNYRGPGWPEALSADVYTREDDSRAPAVLLIHGGSWKADGPRWTMTPIARKLARNGFAVVNVSYRGTPDYTYPAPLDDLREALRWMKVNSGELGIDPDRIATFGFSAGAHLATLLALEDGKCHRVQVIVAGGGPFDLSLYPDDPSVSAFLGGSYRALPERYHQASPVRQVDSRSPPLFLFHGCQDEVVPPEHARRMVQAYRDKGRLVEVRWLNHRGHATSLIFPGSTIDDAVKFLKREL